MGIFRKIGMAAAVSILFVACGDDNSTKASNNESSGPVSDADYEVDDYEDLPNCTSKKEGATGFVIESGEGYVCKGGDWVRDDEAVDVVKSSSSQKTGSSSSGEKENSESSSSGGGSVTLRKCAADFDGKYMGYEGSTYKCYEGFWNPVENPPEDTETQVICLKTEDPNAPLYCYLDTAIWSSSSYEADAEDFMNLDPGKITGGSIEGVAQKGPYLQGSTYRIIPLDGKTLLPVGDTLNESFNNSIGTYTFCDLEMPSQFAMIEASGYYRSELTGNKSNLQMTIGAIVDVQKGANINMLTNLEYERVKYLVQNEGYNIAGAKKRALTEVLAAFHIDADVAVDASGNKLSAEQLDITKDGAANGALLAVSIMIQGAITNTEFDVKAMMKDFREDIKEDGAWTGKSARTVIADFAFAADSAKMFANYRKNVEGWKLSRVVPMFEKYVNDFWASEYGVGKCTEDRFGTIKKNQNAASVHNGNYFLCDTLWYSTQFGSSGFKRRGDYYAEKVYYWRDIDEFERNTRNQVCDVEGLIIPGNIDKDKYYICATDPRNSRDLLWREATDIEVDKYYTECTTDGKLNKFSDEKYYVCDADKFREASEFETFVEKGCVSYLDGVESKLKDISLTCENGTWIYKDGSIVKFSDGKLYKFTNNEFVRATPLDSALGTACVSYLDGNSVEFKNAIHTYTCSNGLWIVDKAWALGNCTKDGKINSMLYGTSSAVKGFVCDADTFRVAVKNDSLFDFACTSYGEGIKDEKNEIEKSECAVRTILKTNECRKSSWSTIVDSSLWDNSACNISYGELNDSRDGQIYKTVKIGDQTWMAENLRYEYNKGSAKSYCYNNSADSCAKYGRLYTWSAAIDSAAVFSTAGKACGYGKTCINRGTVRGICPEGWHLPSKAEFDTLINAVGGSSTAGKVLKSTTGWGSDGADAYGFSALPAGHRDDGLFGGMGYSVNFWSSTEDNISYYAYCLGVSGSSASVFDNKKTKGFSVRCLQD